MSNSEDVFRAAAQRWTDLFDRLSAAPLVTVSGVVSPSGAGGGSLGANYIWTFSCSFEAWRIDGSPVQRSKLSICKKVTEGELKSLMSRIDAYAVLQIRARVLQDAGNGRSEGELVELLGSSADQELQEVASELQKPVTVQDQRFGTFTLDRRINRFDTQVNWCGVPITLSLDGAEPTEFSRAIEVAGRLFDDQWSWSRRINDFAVLQLLSLKNDNWLDEGESALAADDFLSRMTLKEISISADGRFDFWHDDGDLFYGHAIQVYGDIENGPTGADIPG